MEIALREVCGVRAGDKGDTADVTLFADTPEMFEHLCQEVTAEKVQDHLGGIVQGDVRRYLAANVLALKFVMDDALGGGGALSLRSDNLGKALGGAVLRMRVDIPAELRASTPRYGRRAPVTQRTAP